MSFKENYCDETDKTKPENKDKKIISDDAYAIGEILDNILKKVTQTGRING